MKNKYQDILSHLTNDQIDNLMSRYYNGEKNEILIKEYNIDIKPVLLVKAFPVIIHKDRLCPYCYTPLFSYRIGKSASASTIQEQYCQTCDHEDIYICHCSNCVEKRNIERAIKRKEEEEKLTKKYCQAQPVLYQDISFNDSLLLLSLLITNPNLASIEDYKEANILPTKINTEIFISKLILNRSLTLNKDNLLENNDKINNIPNINTFPSIEKTRVLINNSKLELNISRDGSNIISNEELMAILMKDISSSNMNYDKNEIKESFFKLSMFEALSYLYEKDFFLKIESSRLDKIYDSIKTTLKKYTLSQTKGIVKVCYQKYHTAKIPYKENLIIKKIREYDGEMKNYDRHSSRPMCIFAILLCKLVLKTNEDYFQDNVFAFFEEHYKSIA